MSFTRNQNSLKTIGIGRLSNLVSTDFKNESIYSHEDLEQILDRMKDEKISILGKQYSSLDRNSQVEYWNSVIAAIKLIERNQSKNNIKNLGNIYTDDLVKFSFKGKELTGKAWSKFLYKDGRVKVDYHGRMEFRVYDKKTKKTTRYLVTPDCIVKIVKRSKK